MKQEYVALIGIDWGDKEHAWHLRDSRGERSGKIKADSESIGRWLDQLRSHYRSKPIAVGLEQKRGALVYGLLEAGFITVYPINPKTSARYREAFATSRAKDDPDDARICLSLVCDYRDKLTAWKPDDVEVRQLHRLCETRRSFMGQLQRTVNRLRDELKSYYPQALEFAGTHLEAPLAAAFLRRWPSPQKLSRSHRSTLIKFYQDHRCRRSSALNRRLALFEELRALTTDPAVVEPAQIKVGMLVDQVELIRRQIEQLEETIDHLYHRQQDADIFSSFPGAGPGLAPRLLCAFGTDRNRYASSEAIAQYSGIAPVQERSGKSCWVHRRWFRPKFIHQSFFEYAGQSIVWSTWAKAYYLHAKSQGKCHGTAIRALALKWQRIMYVCWRDRVPYNEEAYLQTLRKRGSYLAQLIDNNLKNQPALCS